VSTHNGRGIRAFSASRPTLSFESQIQWRNRRRLSQRETLRRETHARVDNEDWSSLCVSGTHGFVDIDPESVMNNDQYMKDADKSFVVSGTDCAATKEADVGIREAYSDGTSGSATNLRRSCHLSVL
jgi:hypothetical protein